VTVTLSHVSLESALEFVTKTAGYQWLKSGNTYIVGTEKSLAVFGPAKLSSNDRITKTVQFENSDPDDLMSSVKLAFPDIIITLIKPGIDTTTVTGDAGKTTTVSARQKGGVLMVTGQADTVKRVADYVALAEGTFHPDVQLSETTTYRIKYVFGPNLITVLHNLVPKLTVINGPAQQFDSGPQLKFTSTGAGSSSSLEDRYTLPSAMPMGAAGDGYKEKPDGKMTSPTLLILNGTRDDITRALDILSKIDVKPVQLLFEAKVTEINDSDQKQLGVNWDFSQFSTSFGEFVPLDATGKPIPGDTDFPGQVLKVGTISRSRIPNMATATIDALIQNGRAKILARPNVAALDGQKATMFVGDTVNYISSISQTTTGENVTTASVNVGVILTLTGRASDDGYITLYLHPEVSTITQFLSVPGGGSLPQLSSRFADTVIRVKDGDTIAIGGLIQDTTNNAVNKVPILGDLPVLGSFFRDVNKKKTRSEIVFFIKTSLIADHA
jgi:type II secretory pathway component GspD/PulD (secretin)